MVDCEWCGDRVATEGDADPWCTEFCHGALTGRDAERAKTAAAEAREAEMLDATAKRLKVQADEHARQVAALRALLEDVERTLSFQSSAYARDLSERIRKELGK